MYSAYVETSRGTIRTWRFLLRRIRMMGYDEEDGGSRWEMEAAA